MSTVLIVNATPDIRRAIADLLRRDGHTVDDALLCEMKGGDGQSRVVAITSAGHLADAIRSLQGCGVDALEMPSDPRGVIAAVTSAAANGHSTRRPAARCDRAATEFIAVSPIMRDLLARTQRVAQVDTSVLITGDSGVGKEVIARSIYEQGGRRGRFVPVNCGAIPESLVESELFGCRKGAFTGAVTDRRGLIQEAEGGVLFLDEIGEMPAAMQVRLLRFLDSGEVRRVGDTTSRRVDVRTIAATNRSLEREVHEGRFRLDLFYRLNVLSLTVPPLKHRREDIGALASLFLARAAARLPKPVRQISHEAQAILERHPWPGNVRELQNVIECAAVMAPGDTIRPEHLPAALLADQIADRTAVRARDDLRHVATTLHQCGGNQTHAAAALGISRTTLWRRLRHLDSASLIAAQGL